MLGTLLIVVKVLLGVLKLLTIEPDIRINTVVATEGVEAIAAAQGK